MATLQASTGPAAAVSTGDVAGRDRIEGLGSELASGQSRYMHHP